MNEIGKIIKSKIPSLFFRSKESILNTLSQPCDLTNCLEFILMNFYLLNNMLGFFVQNFRKSFTVYCIRRASSILSEKSLRLLYVSFINSNLIYCGNMYCWLCLQNKFEKITLIQKKL